MEVKKFYCDFCGFPMKENEGQIHVLPLHIFGTNYYECCSKCSRRIRRFLRDLSKEVSK